MEIKYNPNEETKYIQHLDENNLYGYAMSNPLPVKDFELISEEEMEDMMEDYERMSSCMLEVDLEYPDNVHDDHNDYPLVPELIEVNKAKKLIPNLNNKKNYIVHHKTLKLYLKHCLKLSKINRGVKYHERDFLKKYIDSNTLSRT